ncbi:endonuclease VII domain-containing protein [Streptomyces sp. NE06-03E]|uniref:Recombination endonuclease VII n=3 Tax=Streptomyces TaxID=1883 RepID=A0A652KND6_9ACTN|nr:MULTISPECIES: endonuclease VII domain-containing protein [unclassified Streptomyces]MDX3324455.1 endonuclease VII domain-containing protein [Streptomyces sp. ME02-6979-3A]TXS25162.1 recombination endonuclease VII [Streptomyces sp. gb1(2016)]WSS60888.1 endonuclease VII domain-containing protein [Streptomyces sp. NBC_01177]WSS67933.1 endonuclease VII domain-containing protein [Streptomyces sp. NBC_01175]WSS74927.1 endonuclease VII domain-containing protein [Streptomyces sp. NBC_01174]
MSDVSASRKCSRCRRALPTESFASNRAMRDGLQAYCRECSAEYYRQRQEARGRSVRVKVPVPRGHKRCPRCGEVKPHDQWERNRSAYDGWSSYCRPCRAERNRISYFQRKYGLSPVELDELIAAQQGVCCICLTAPAEHVDHCHETGRVRGVLCFSCNAALGQLKDRPDAVRRAAAYLEGNAWKPTLVAPGVYQLPS